MRRYHHIEIPTTEAKPGETHLKHLKLFVVSHEKSEFGVEWMRFEADAVVPDLVRQVPHVAFEVADLASELAGRALSFRYPRTQQECPSFSASRSSARSPLPRPLRHARLLPGRPALRQHPFEVDVASAVHLAHFSRANGRKLVVSRTRARQVRALRFEQSYRMLS
jgi:hypothetical protein